MENGEEKIRAECGDRKLNGKGWIVESGDTRGVENKCTRLLNGELKTENRGRR